MNILIWIIVILYVVVYVLHFLDSLPIVIVVPKLWVSAVTIGPLIFIRARDYHKILLNHEVIHYTQQIQMLFVFAYLQYFIEFFIKLLIHRSFKKAYERISFEREAYVNQQLIGYLHIRPFWRHFKYVFGLPIKNLHASTNNNSKR